MLKKFSGRHGDALDFMKAHSARHGVTVYFCSAYDHPNNTTCTIVATSPHVGLLPSRTGVYSPGSGWWFGGAPCPHDRVAEALALADIEPLEEGVEKNAELFSCYTLGYTPEQIVLMARSMKANNTCVWHECARASGRLDKCVCGACERARSSSN